MDAEYGRAVSTSWSNVSFTQPREPLLLSFVTRFDHMHSAIPDNGFETMTLLRREDSKAGR